MQVEAVQAARERSALNPAEAEAIRLVMAKAWKPGPNPKCKLCGLEMRLERFDGEDIVWRCDGALSYDKWDRPILMPGRLPNDDHSIKSELRTRQIRD